MALQEERRRSGFKDGRPGSQDAGRGRKMVTRDAKKTAVPERWALGKPEKWPSKKDGRSGAKKTGGMAGWPSGWQKNGRDEEDGGGEPAKAVWALPAVGWLKGETPDDSVLSVGRRMGGSEGVQACSLGRQPELPCVWAQAASSPEEPFRSIPASPAVDPGVAGRALSEPPSPERVLSSSATRSVTCELTSVGSAIVGLLADRQAIVYRAVDEGRVCRPGFKPWTRAGIIQLSPSLKTDRRSTGKPRACQESCHRQNAILAGR